MSIIDQIANAKRQGISERLLTCFLSRCLRLFVCPRLSLIKFLKIYFVTFLPSDSVFQRHCTGIYKVSLFFCLYLCLLSIYFFPSVCHSPSFSIAFSPSISYAPSLSFFLSLLPSLRLFLFLDIFSHPLYLFFFFFLLSLAL